MTRWVRTREDLAALLGSLAGTRALALDSESDSLHHHAEKVCLVQLASEPGGACLIDPLALRDLSPLAPLIADAGVVKVFHGADYDVTTMKRDFAFSFASVFDTMIAAGLLGKQRVGLKELAFYELKLHEPLTAIEELIGRGSKQISFDKVPVEQATPYAAADADMTLRLKLALEEQLAGYERISSLFTRLEMPLVPVLVEMERAGIALDKEYIEALGERLGQRIREIEAGIHEAAGGPFNINSGAQLNAVLFESVTNKSIDGCSPRGNVARPKRPIAQGPWVAPAALPHPSPSRSPTPEARSPRSSMPWTNSRLASSSGPFW